MRENPGCRVALVAPTLGDGRDTMVEGVSGMLAVFEVQDLRGGTRETAWNRSLLELYHANGSQAKVFGSDAADRLRGPEHEFVWAEEVSSWRDAHLGNVAETTWNNAVLGTRGGEHPQFVITSTPKPNKLTKHLVSIGQPTLVMVTGSSYENQDNLPQSWWDAVVAPLEGTRTGRQEIMAELLEDIEGALWKRTQLDALRVTEAPDLKRVVVAVDPNATGGEAANDAGIVVVGIGAYDGHGYVLADKSVGGGPYEWSRAAVQAYDYYDADSIVAEKNQGGDMVAITIHAVRENVPVKLVHASRGKRTRAEPIAVLYDGKESNPERPEPGKVHHVRYHDGVPVDLDDLEEQMLTWTPDAESPDRMDALVWGLTELMIGRRTGVAKILNPNADTGGVVRGGIIQGLTTFDRGGYGGY
jgi:phage terminase large subunit-like protein